MQSPKKNMNLVENSDKDGSSFLNTDENNE
jgi:hypothetical protein